MINVFQNTYDTRLQSWYQLRQSLENSTLEKKCIDIDNFWQKVPLVNHYLHLDNMDEWPSPWELIYDNNYCTVARGLGMAYTLLLLGIHDIVFAEATDYNNEDLVLVLVDRAKYVLNYWPNTVVNNCLQDFTIKKTVPITDIITKIG